MKRLSKEKCNGTLEGATLSSETGFIKIQFKKEEWNLESFDEKISTFSKDISKGKLILTLKETDLSYMYELKFEEKIEIKEEVKMTTTNIFEKERTLLGVDTYKNNEKFIEFESENEKGFGLVKDGKVIIPCREVEDKIECIVFDYSELNSYEFESYKEYNLPEENLIYRFNKTEAIDFKKRKDIEIPVTSSILDCFKFDNIDYVYTKPNELIFKYSDNVHLLKKFKTNSVDFIISTVIEEKDNYEGYGLRYKRYIPKKTTKGITDLRNNPFAWLNY